MDRERLARAIAPWLAGLVAAVCLLTLVAGWAGGARHLVRLRADLAVMAPSTALGLLALAVALLIWLNATRADRRREETEGPDGAEGLEGADAWGGAEAPRRPRDGGASRVARLVLAALAAALALSSHVVFALGIAPSIDQVALGSFSADPDDAMSPATALCLLLSAGALALIDAPSGRRAWLSEAMITAALLLALLDVIAYLFDTHALYSVAALREMSPQTALALTALLLAMILARPDLGWTRTILSDAPGGQFARRVLPVAILAPLALGLLANALAQAGYYHHNFTRSFLTLAGMAMMTLPILWAAQAANRLDAERRRVKQELILAVQAHQHLLQELRHRTKNNLQQMTSLIAIEERSLSDRLGEGALGSLSGRVRALGAIHGLLLDRAVPEQVDFDDFLRRLCEQIAQGVGAARLNIEVEVDAEPREVDAETAISLGLIVNELIVNACKHAFGPEGGRVEVRFAAGEDGIDRLTVSDDGKGWPDGAEGAETGAPRGGRGAGTKVVDNLARQIGATVLRGPADAASGRGARVELRAPLRSPGGGPRTKAGARLAASGLERR